MVRVCNAFPALGNCGSAFPRLRSGWASRSEQDDHGLGSDLSCQQWIWLPRVRTACFGDIGKWVFSLRALGRRGAQCLRSYWRTGTGVCVVAPLGLVADAFSSGTQPLENMSDGRARAHDATPFRLLVHSRLQLTCP